MKYFLDVLVNFDWAFNPERSKKEYRMTNLDAVSCMYYCMPFQLVGKCKLTPVGRCNQIVYPHVLKLINEGF